MIPKQITPVKITPLHSRPICTMILWISARGCHLGNSNSTCLTRSSLSFLPSLLFPSMCLSPNNEMKSYTVRASLVAQWLKVCLPMQGTWVRALVWKDPTCRGATRPMSHNCWACTSGACAPQQERPRWWEARTLRWRVTPACRNWREPSHRGEDPTEPKINK